MNTVVGSNPLHNLQQSDANVSKHKNIKSQAIRFYVKPVKRRKKK